MSEASKPRPSEAFYNALPCRKAELVDGKFIVGGRIEKSAMTLRYLLDGLGEDYLARLVPAELLAQAKAQVGTGQALLPVADFGKVTPGYRQPAKLAWDLRLGLHGKGLVVGGNTQVVKLGEDGFMPDLYILTEASALRQKEYYLDGPPDLAIEISTPSTREFDYGTRLERYAQAGLPEVWMLDISERRFRPHVLGDAGYQELALTGPVYSSLTLPGFGVEHGRFFETVDEFGSQILEIFTVPEQVYSRVPHPNTFESEIGGLAFQPRFSLEPVPIQFEEYVSWGGELKFEYMNGKPMFGGSAQSTKEWVALLVMTLGVRWCVGG